MTPLNQELLERIGLTKDETKMYAALLASDALSVQQLSEATGIKRGNAYNVAESLACKGVATRTSIRGVAHFRAAEPTQLLALAEDVEEQARHHREALELAVPGLMSAYLVAHHQPVIRTLEGLKGLQKVYDDILRTQENILLIRSIYDDASYHLVKLIDKQMRAQVEAGIGVRMIAPYTPEGIERMRTTDTENRVERRMIPVERLTLPAQVMVYDHKVVLTDLRNQDTIISTVIENASIAESFRILFEYLWEQSTPEHYALMKQLIGIGNGDEK